MENKLLLLIFLPAFLGETQGIPSPSIQNTCKDNTYTLCKHGVQSACSCREAADNGWCNSDHYTIQNCKLTCGLCQPGSPNSVPAVVSEVPITVGHHGPCNPNPCGAFTMCEVQGGAALCKPDLNAFFGGRNVTSSLPEGPPPPEEDSEAEVVPVVPITDAPIKPVAAEEYDPAIAPIAGEPNAPIIDAPIRPVAAKPKTSLIGQLGPIAYVPTPEARAPVVTPRTPPMAPVIPPAVGFEPVAEGPKAVTAYVAEPVPSAPIVPIASNQSDYTGAKPIAEMREYMVTDAPIVPIAATPKAIVMPPPIAEHPEGTAEPPPAGRDNAAGWGFKGAACDGYPCGPNTKCSVAPNGMPRCRCLEGFVPNENTIVGCKPRCMSNEECPGDFYCKDTKCVRVCGPGACGLKADCDGYQNRAICNCPQGYEGDPYIQCDRVFSNSSSGGAAIGKFVVLDINNDLTQDVDEPIRVVYMDNGKDVTEEERAEALGVLKMAKEAEAAAEAEKLVGAENNAIRETVSAGLLIVSMLAIMQVSKYFK